MADKIVTQAVERLRLAAEADKKQRDREKEDLAFQVPELQWSAAAKADRMGSIVNGIPLQARPMLSIPKLDQPIQLVLNQEKSAHLGVQVHALSEDANDDTAEVFQGLYRCIERDSRANLARSWAFERGVKAGRGAYRILTEPAPGYSETGDQNIVIKRILYQDAVYFDPFAIEPDWSDGEWAFVTEWVQWAKYKRLYSKSKLSGYDTGELTELTDEASDCPDWIKGDGESRAVLIAEYFCVEGEGDERKVIWRKMNGIEILSEQAWMGKYIPIIPVIGRELIPFDGERRWTGIYGPNKDAQRMFNHAASAAVESAATEPKNPYIIAEGQEEGHEQEFLLSATKNFPYVRYKPTTVAGQVVAPPQRSQTDTSKLTLSMQMLSMAGDFIHAGTGAFEPTLGQNSPNVKTKGATLALQAQHDQGNSNWLDNLAEISLVYEAKVVLDLIPHVYDRPGRVARTLDIEDESTSVVLNQPFIPGTKSNNGVRGQRPQPIADGQPLPQGAKPDQVKHYNLKDGTYGVTVSIGKSYKSRVDQGKDELGQLFQAEPQLFGMLGDIYLKFADFPGHKEAAERIKKMLPPPLQEKDQQQDPAMQLQQAQAQLQQMGQQMQEMAKALETDKVKVDGQVQIAKFKEESAVLMQKMKDATSITVAQIQAAAKGLQMATEAENEAQATGREHAFDARESANSRAHDVAMASVGQAHAMDQNAAQGQQDAALSDQGHQQALEQGDQGQAHALEQGQQAAALAPQPEAGE